MKNGGSYCSRWVREEFFEVVQGVGYEEWEGRGAETVELEVEAGGCASVERAGGRRVVCE